MRILCVGKLKEGWQKEACQDYVKRISRFEKIEICEVADEPETDPRAMEKEGQALLGHLKDSEFAVALTLEGTADDSPRLAKRYDAWRMSGKSVAFLIGGSLGLSQAVRQRADAQISLSKLTFPHALARIVLLEQMFRCHKILSGERYHK